MNPEPQVRPASAADAEGIEALRVLTWRAGYAGIAAPAYLAALTGDVQRRRSLIAAHSPDAVGLTAVAGDDLVGWLSAGPARDDDCDPTDVGEIYACYVHPEHWRYGLGRRLLVQALDTLAKGPFEQATLWVLADNARGRGFYEAFGFQPDGSERIQYLGVALTEVRYRLTLEVTV